MLRFVCFATLSLAIVTAANQPYDEQKENYLRVFLYLADKNLADSNADNIWNNATQESKIRAIKNGRKLLPYLTAGSKYTDLFLLALGVNDQEWDSIAYSAKIVLAKNRDNTVEDLSRLIIAIKEIPEKDRLASVELTNILRSNSNLYDRIKELGKIPRPSL